MDRNLALEAVRVTEAAALASGRLMGRGDIAACDDAATEAMAKAFRSIAVDGVVVIGEGDADDDQALCCGDRIGSGSGPEIDVALDALEGSTICATGGFNALSVIAFAARGGFLRCPDTAMEKIVVGPAGRGVTHIERSPIENLRALAEARGVYVADLAVAILDRPRHEKLIAQIREAGARIKLLADGDVAAGIATALPESGVDMLIGVGGSWQGILTAAAIRSTGGEMQARLRPRNAEERERVREAGIDDVDRVYTAEAMASGSVMFAATAVTDGQLLPGVRFFKGGATTHSVVMRSRTHTMRFIEARHRFDLKPEY
jgi:fructose-1,6-bisphosphatase class II